MTAETSAKSAPTRPSRVRAFLHEAADGIELWMLDSGAVDQLAFLVARTGLARQIILSAATALLGAGAVQGSLAEALIGAAVAILIGTVNSFVARIRNKWAERLQHVVGVETDKFIGGETVAEVARLVIRDAAKDARNMPPDPES